MAISLNKHSTLGTLTTEQVDENWTDIETEFDRVQAQMDAGLQLDNPDATVDPGASNDSSEGYGVGSRWFNQATGGRFTCRDASAGAAVWDLDAKGPLGSAAFADIGTESGDVPDAGTLKTASPTIFTVDQLRRSVEASSGGRMTVLYTDKGQPSYMHVLPKFLIEDAVGDSSLGTGVHPAFIKGGVEMTELFIGAYLASEANGEALSLPMQDPRTSINYDSAKSLCAANGTGWHLMTNWEWAAVALWCMANGYEPLGNTNYGRHHNERYQTGRRQDGGVPGNSSGIARTLTGSGPAAWAHDGTPAGIHDLVGNVWEWVGGFKLQDGRVIMPPDNDYDLAEASWAAQDLWFSSGSSSASSSNLNLVTAEIDVVRNGTVGDDSSGFTDSRAPWSAMTITGTPPQITEQSLIAPGGISPVGTAYARTYGERLPLRGGRWSYGGAAGLAALDLRNPRSIASSNLGFRPAFAV